MLHYKNTEKILFLIICLTASGYQIKCLQSVLILPLNLNQQQK